MADHLLAANQALKRPVDSEAAGMRTAETLQAYDILHNHLVRAAALKQRANEILQAAAQLQAAAKQVLAVEQDRLAAQTLLQEELAWRRGHLC